MKSNTLLFLVLYLLFPSLTFAQAQDGLIRVTGNGLADVMSIAVNNGDQLTVAGYISGNSYINDSAKLSGNDSFDVFVSRMDEHGNVAWSRTFGGKGSNSPNALAVDAEGNTFVTGYFRGPFSIDGQSFSNSSKYHYFFTKLDNSGRVLWGKSYTAPNEGSINTHSVYCDNIGNVYLILQLYDSVNVDGNVFRNGRGGYSNILLKYKTDGTLLWGKVLDNLEGSLSSVADDHYGHLYISGGLGRGNIHWGGKNIPGITVTTRGVYLAKLDAATGDMLWMQTGKTGTYSGTWSTLVDHEGKVYISGAFGDSITFQSFKAKVVGKIAYGDQDAFIIKTDTSGNILWHTTVGSFEPNYFDAICLDADDNLYATGTYDDSLVVGSIKMKSLSRDAFVLKYDKNGNLLSYRDTKAYSQYSLILTNSMAVDEHDRILVGGAITYATHFGDTSLTTGSGGAGFIWELPTAFSSSIADAQRVQDNDIASYPNPASDLVHLKIPATSASSILTLIDAVGNTVISRRLPASIGQNIYTVDVSGLREGIYFVRITGEESYNTLKLIKR
jgi:hypothetical protein